MTKRPKIKIKLSPLDWLIELAAFLVLFVFWSVLLWTFNDLPEQIPTHFNAAGQADAFGSKSNLFSLPIISTVMVIGLTFLNRYPHLFNYPQEITDTNAEYQYRWACRLIRWLKLVVALIFSAIGLTVIWTDDATQDGLGWWFLPSTLLLVFGSILFFIYKSLKDNK